MDDINWFCDLMRIKLSLYRKIIVKINCGKYIARMKKILDKWRRLCKRF